MILIGTSGFSYADWKPGFYPPTISDRDMLAFYSRYFPACEINFTYYRLPTAETMAAMAKKAGGRVIFVVKAHQSMTHGRDAGPADYAAFSRGLAPLQDAGVLGGILAQFPFSFGNTLDHRAYLADLKTRLHVPAPLIVEFRHRSWNQPEAFAFLRELELSYVNVDEPDLKGLLPATAEATGPVGYVRFHGRNREKWFARDAEPWERYDYLYRGEELQEWVPRIHQVAGRTRVTFVFFNNHWKAQAVANARQMAGLLGIPLLEALGGEP
jgi:uncharacterized protein YecE (DUF72 family)